MLRWDSPLKTQYFPWTIACLLPQPQAYQTNLKIKENIIQTWDDFQQLGM